MIEPSQKRYTVTVTDPVGVLEVAERLGVKDRTVHMWRFREIVPPYDIEEVNGSGAWAWHTILAWAGHTGRLNSPELVEEYRRIFETDPVVSRSPGTRAKLTASDCRRIAEGEESIEALAEEYDVSPSTVRRVRDEYREKLGMEVGATTVQR